MKRETAKPANDTITAICGPPIATSDSQWLSLGARTEFAGLIADLIRATARSIEAFRFPTGDKSQVRGFDGYLEADAVPPFVPGGRSIWEFGTAEGALGKADEDYEKRKAKEPRETAAKSTFVFASPWTWDHPRLNLQDWLRSKREENFWADVRLIDGTQIEAWLGSCPAVGQEHFDRLRAIANRVFTHVKPEPDPDAPFTIENDRTASYSKWLRGGLAQTVLMVATLGGRIGLDFRGGSPQKYADQVVNELPNLRSHPGLLESLKNELPLLAEAAPEPFLKALEPLLEGDARPAIELLTEKEGMLSPSSAHPNVLWALETLAWDPRHLERVSLVLARMAEVDPGGRLANRPINSLRKIFLAWAPNTNARLAQRKQVLDKVIATHAKVGWLLLSELLPDSHNHSSPSPKPRYREAGQSQQEVLTNRIVHQSYQFATERALEEVGSEANRWADIIKAMSNFEPSLRTKAYGLLDQYLSNAGSDEASATWANLRNEVARHQSFIGANWALPPEEVAQLERLVVAHTPIDPVERIAWLFDDDILFVPEDDAANPFAAVEEARVNAVKRILELGDPTVLERLVQRVKRSHLLAGAIGKASPRVELFADLVMTSLQDPKLRAFAANLSAIAGRSLGADWQSQIRSWRNSGQLTDNDVVELYLFWPFASSTWTAVATFGTEIESLYWKRVSAWAFELNEIDSKFAAEHLMQAGRSASALSALYRNTDRLPVDMVLHMLDAAVAELNSASGSVSDNFGHQIRKIFEALDARPDANIEDIAHREYAYLPLLRFHRKGMALHRLMAADASFFVSVLADVYRRAGDDWTEATEPEKRRAQAGFELLYHFEMMPGAMVEGVDDAHLRKWIEEVQRIASREDRTAVADQHIGKAIACAPADPVDGAWPHRSVRGVIDLLSSTDIERGISIQRHNMRGVVSKALYEGGKQERELAAQYRSWSDTASAWPRTSAMLRWIADDWERQAASEDVRAEQMKLEG